MPGPAAGGLSAFPLTPTSEDGVDLDAFAGLVGRLAAAGVGSIGALGSTGGYVYLTRAERARAARVAVEAADGTPVVVGIGALRTRDVLALAHDAQEAGAAGVLLAPVSYQPLTPEEVFGLYEDVTRDLSVPLCVYDNPATTRFAFTDELHARIAALPRVASVKIPPVPADPVRAAERVAALRAVLPASVGIGVSGDPSAAAGLLAGCDLWSSVLAGVLPGPCLRLVAAAASGSAGAARAACAELEPVWELFARHGSLRVVSALAQELGLVTGPDLPRPLRGLDPAARADVRRALDALGPAAR